MYYKELIVWQKAMLLTTEVYTLTKIFPKEEMYGLTSQMRRSVVSISSNIAEGSRRKTKKDRNYFLTIAYGSVTELENQILISKDLTFATEKNFQEIDKLLLEVLKMLNKMTTY